MVADVYVGMHHARMMDKSWLSLLYLLTYIYMVLSTLGVIPDSSVPKHTYINNAL